MTINVLVSNFGITVENRSLIKSKYPRRNSMDEFYRDISVKNMENYILSNDCSSSLRYGSVTSPFSPFFYINLIVSTKLSFYDNYINAQIFQT